MHIADGIVAADVAVAADAIVLIAVSLIGRKAKADDVPKMGLMTAALFVVSLIHFPIAGTSLHLGLFGLAGILLGVESFPVIFVALLFQALVFQHGGILSLGLNTINMGMGAFVGWIIWKADKIPDAARSFAAGFLGIMTAALLMTLEFKVSGYGRGVFFILALYLILAAVEGILTMIIIDFFRRTGSTILQGE